MSVRGNRSQAEATPAGSQVEVVQARRPRSGGTTREEGLNGRLTSSEISKHAAALISEYNDKKNFNSVVQILLLLIISLNSPQEIALLSLHFCSHSFVEANTKDKCLKYEQMVWMIC